VHAVYLVRHLTLAMLRHPAGSTHSPTTHALSHVSASGTWPRSSQPGAIAASLPPQDVKVICDAECSAKLESVPEVSLPSGLKYKDIVVGNGPTPPVGFQVWAPRGGRSGEGLEVRR
jgi:hypothetical protein